LTSFLSSPKQLAALAALGLAAVLLDRRFLGLGVLPTLALFVAAAACGRFLYGRIAGSRSRPARLTASALGGMLAVGLIIQAVPYGRAHSNPAVTAEPAWDSPNTRQLAVRACFDCHSNQVNYPWYSNLAPVSWALEHHVQSGREALNFSEWDRPQEEAHEAAESVEEASMPPRFYLDAHPGARFSPQERAALIAGLEATLGREERD